MWPKQVTGSKSIEPGTPHFDGPFVEGDNWWYGEDAGLCSEQETGDKGYDAAGELFEAVSDLIPDPNGNYFFINHEDYNTEGGKDFIRLNNPLDNHWDYRLFFASTAVGACGDDTLCLEWPEMNFYYVQLKNLIFDYLPDNVPELQGLTIETFMEMDDDSEITGVNPPVITYKHYVELKYGQKVGFTNGINPTEI